MLHKDGPFQREGAICKRRQRLTPAFDLAKQPAFVLPLLFYCIASAFWRPPRATYHH